MSNYKYKIVLFDDEIPVCEVRYNDTDLAQFIGNQVTAFIGTITQPDAYTNESWDSLYEEGSTGWAGNGFSMPIYGVCGVNSQPHLKCSRQDWKVIGV